MTTENTTPAAEQELQQEPPTKPNILVNVIREGHECELMLQRTGQNTADPLLEDLKAALAEKAVVQGIKEDLLRDLASAPIYNKNIVVAVGKKPTVGKDGELRFLIRTERNLRPAIREDGTADYKDMGFTNNVEKGQVLCEIIPPEKGEDGIDVTGKVLEGIYGKDPPSPKGAGTELSEDGLQLLAAVSGNAEVKGHVVSIQEMLRLKGGVDNATGDIVFVGDVYIGGDVASGFTVSGVNVTIKGNVEGATLQATGDVVLAEGMNGMNRGTITAGGNVKAKYLQNCTIRAEGNIFADTIMYSNIECDGDVELNGKRAALIGGRSFIAGKLLAKTLGTEAHTTTQINMATTGMASKRQAEELAARIQSIDADITKLVQLLNRMEELKKQNKLTQEHLATIQQVKDNYVMYNADRKKTADELEALKRRQVEESRLGSYIECKDRIHTGVRITFGPLTYNVQDSFVHSRIGIVDGDVAVSTL